jgi:GGDEF domain-containing protein
MKIAVSFNNHGFTGTPQQAEAVFRALEPDLSEEERYVLLRYLDLDVPKRLDDRYGFAMTDARYMGLRQGLLNKIPKEVEVPVL